MKNNDIMDIQNFLNLLDTPTKGSVTERSIALTVLKRTFTYLQSLKQDLVCEINQLVPDEKAPHGWRGIAVKDEFYECAKDGYRTGVALVVRTMADGTPVRAVALVMSSDLTEELFGKVSITVNLLQPIENVVTSTEVISEPVEQTNEAVKPTTQPTANVGAAAATAPKETETKAPIATTPAAPVVNTPTATTQPATPIAPKATTPATSQKPAGK